MASRIMLSRIMLSRIMLWWSAALLSLGASLGPSLAPASAETAEQASAICERAILRGARAGGVPETVLHAISLTETGRTYQGRLRPWPWAINREGKGFWFATREEALAFAKASLAEGRPSFDVGCFQINYRWHGHGFSSLEAMFDPDTGAEYAARFLDDLRRELGDWTRAAGAYHSRTPRFAAAYRARYERILAGLGGAPLVVAEAEPGEPAVPRKSRTRMSRGPLIITVERPQPPARDPDVSAERDGGALRVVLTRDGAARF